MKHHPQTGILIHGRHLQALGWERMVWSEKDSPRLGTLPTAVLAALHEDIVSIAFITLGTGASRKETGAVEAQVMKDTLVEKFSNLEDFPQIANHPQWQKHKELIHDLVSHAIIDIDSQNTREEIENAAALFEQHDITKVIEVTGASHAPRCQLLQSIARDEGTIPNSQQWQLVADDIPYTDTAVGDTVVFEEPHRGNDSLLDIPGELRPAKLFRQFFAIPQTQQKSFLKEAAALFEKYRA